MQSNNEKSSATEFKLVAAPLWRRLAAILYDGLMLICLIFVAWQPVPLLPDDPWPQWVSQGIRLIYLFTVAFLFFGWFWTHGGQTIGMRAWKIRLIDRRSNSPAGADSTWSQALVRFFVAMISWSSLGLGFLWALTNQKRLTWHDLASGTLLIRVQ